MSVMQKSDMHLRIGRRLEAGSRSESYIYICLSAKNQNANKFILIAIGSIYLHWKKNRNAACKGKWVFL